MECKYPKRVKLCAEAEVPGTKGRSVKANILGKFKLPQTACKCACKELLLATWTPQY